MLKLICDKCNNELNELGAILLSPPKDGNVKKIHICVQCYDEIIKLFNIKNNEKNI